MSPKGGGPKAGEVGPLVRETPAHLTLAHAALLGLAHGPAELLPVSSSAHTELIPWFARWPEARLAPDVRKTLQVALHAGTAAGQLVRERAAVGALLRTRDPRRLGVVALSALAPGVAGLALERPIERRLQGPVAIACGLLAGSAAMALADARAQQVRGCGDARVRDGLLLGLAQAAALAPGVSRSGATLATARALGFTRAGAAELSRTVALPVILGASALKARRLAAGRDGPDVHEQPGLRSGLAAAAACAFASALACPRPGREGGALWPYAAYRSALAIAVLARARRT